MKSGKRTLKKSSSSFKEIAVDLIDHPDDVIRMDIDRDRMKELAESIKERGLLQPILVYPKGDRFGIIAGDRRFMAHEMLGLKKIMCCVRDASDVDIVIDRAVENLQRENLTPLEEAFIYVDLKQKKGMKLEEISKVVRKSVGVVERRMLILNMPDSFQRALHEGRVSISVAEELWSCPDSAKREYFMNMAVEHGITKDIARMWVSEFRKAKRSEEHSSEPGRGDPLAFNDVPIYRACDVCRDAVEYGKIKELRICAGCNEAIATALKRAK